MRAYSPNNSLAALSYALAASISSKKYPKCFAFLFSIIMALHLLPALYQDTPLYWDEVPEAFLRFIPFLDLLAGLRFDLLLFNPS